ncbi:MAG: hypothetical protein IPM91_10130 [Bacteroidetes bacterium]|nr:hypothetical protein [Bacteroidota bacterium]
MKRSTFLFLLFLLMLIIHKATASGSGKLVFIENKGQWPREALYKAFLANGSVFITADGLVFKYTTEKKYIINMTPVPLQIPLIN